MQIVPAELIRKKRDGGELTEAEVRAFLAGVIQPEGHPDRLGDDQVAAMLMAIFFRGLAPRELAAWADAMTRSGEVVDLSHLARAKIDKHSTGGVGDKISIPLAPAVAACGVAVPMISGRGLGHTGGTLDKLESIPGFRVDLPIAQFVAQLERLGTCLIGQTATLAPADRRLYKTRDVTATVESVPLIASSIMSKKLAEGIDGLVLDCKVGTGAFMKSVAAAKELCAAIQEIGRAAGKRVTAVLTAMDEPIGRTIGNALEIRESIEVLRGGGPADTRELTCALGAEMLLLGGAVADAAEGKARIEAALTSGAALELFRKVVEAQGGDPAVCDAPGRVLPRAKQHDEVVLPAGTITAVDSQKLGMAALVLGAGRRRQTDPIDPAAGLVVDAYVGEALTGETPSVQLFHNLDAKDDRVAQAHALVREAFTITAGAPPTPPAPTRILEVLR